jgi:phosphonate transport system substrate-binding protein
MAMLKRFKQLDRRSVLGTIGAGVMSFSPFMSHGQSITGSPLVFALFPVRSDTEKLLSDWAPLFALLSRALGRPVKGVVREEAAIVSGLKSGEIHLAWIGNVSALSMVQQDAGAVFARISTEAGGDEYSSLLVVSANSPLKSLDDVLLQADTLDAAFGKPTSFSGYAVPRYYAMVRSRIKVEPGRFFKSVRYGSHKENMEAVATGAVHVATTNSDELLLLGRRDPGAPRRLRTVWTSPPIPQSPLVWGRALAPADRARVERFFWQMNVERPEFAAALRPIKLAGFSRSSNKQLIRILDVQMFMDMEASMVAGKTHVERRIRMEEVAKRSSGIELKLKYENNTF